MFPMSDLAVHSSGDSPCCCLLREQITSHKLVLQTQQAGCQGTGWQEEFPPRIVHTGSSFFPLAVQTLQRAVTVPRVPLLTLLSPCYT